MNKIYVLLLLVCLNQHAVAQLNSRPVFEAVVITENGDSLLLADTLDAFRGNVILVDYWASWCGPCWREMPHSDKLKKALQSEKVVFLYLSTDVDHAKWIGGLKKMKTQGMHFRITAESKPSIQSTYNIPGIPFYQILGKDGELLVNDAPWPGSGKLEQKIRNHL